MTHGSGASSVRQDNLDDRVLRLTLVLSGCLASLTTPPPFKPLPLMLNPPRTTNKSTPIMVIISCVGSICY